MITQVFTMVVIGCAGVGGIWGLMRVEKEQVANVLQSTEPIEFVLIDVPEFLNEVLLVELQDLAYGSWMDTQLCQQVHDRLSGNGWIRQVLQVSKSRANEVQIRCDYRVPLALVQQREYFYLVDEYGIRLPGQYAYDARWMVIQGVHQELPDTGKLWSGKDIRAGVVLAKHLVDQPYRQQITAIVVHNYGGREDRLRSHIELVTDQSGARILWGSAPGEEIEENSVMQKLAILANNFQSSGRIDAGATRIDISVFPDRFIIPKSL